jgi:hypothetical protein
MQGPLIQNKIIKFSFGNLRGSHVSAVCACAFFSACSGEMVANMMPGAVVEIGSNTFAVQDTARGVTVQNFEAGRTSPAVLITNAGLAAEQVTGCRVNLITKDGLTNTYYAAMSCPDT